MENCRKEKKQAMKERLEQMADLRNEIRQLEKEFTISRFKDASNYETRGREAQAERKLLKLNGLLRETEEWLKTVDNSRIRQIITYRYEEGLTWANVAAKMGYRYSADGCRKACARFFEKN